MAEKRALIHNLKHETYVRIAKASYGVGVVAIRAIPAHTEPFATAHEDNSEFICLTAKNVALLPKPVRTMVDDFFVEHNGNYNVPSSGLNAINISYFMNHSDTPNVDVCESGGFLTNRKI